MLRKLLLSVALVVCVSAPGLADINQSQGFGIGLSSVVDLHGGLGTASDIQAFTLNLAQMVTQPSGVSALQGSITSGEPLQLGTTAITFDGQTFTGGLVGSDAINGIRLSMLDKLPVLGPIGSAQ
jgi:hypothetical protein